MAIQSPLIKKFLTIGGVLIIVQVAAIFLMSKGDSAAKTPKEAIDTAVSKLQGLSPDRREMMKVQLALADYMSKHQGTPPATLNELVGSYLQSIPIDPATNRPFKYSVEGKKYLLGDKPAETGSAGAKKAGLAAGPGPQRTFSADEISTARDELLSVLTQDDTQKSPPYDPSGKKDPFKPFDIAPKDSNSAAKTPLEALAIDQFSYSAYVETESEPKAIIENPDGRGYTVTKGMKIGLHGGEVTDILPNKIIIVESQVDFTGQTQTRTFEIPIGVKQRGSERRR